MFQIAIVLFLASSCVSANIVDDWDNPGPRRVTAGPTIRIQQGLIRGEIEFYDVVRSHVSFKGIPYAQGQ